MSSPSKLGSWSGPLLARGWLDGTSENWWVFYWVGELRWERPSVLEMGSVYGLGPHTT